MRDPLRRTWRLFLFNWRYPNGFCKKHREGKNRWIGCQSCFSEAIVAGKRQQREDRIEEIGEGVRRVLVSIGYQFPSKG
jgi:hypothetical protein